MTDVEKAKAYDEALERAKNFIENGDEGEKTIAESIFAGLMPESEDERIRKWIIKEIKATLNSIAFLEQLGYTCIPPSKQKEQKPVEWSEEDEKMLRTIISDGSRCVELDSKQISWLKALPSRYKSLRPNHWKPSEEQIAILGRVVNDLKTQFTGATVKEQLTLESLFNDLKNL